jgi:hypothetical protein
MLIKLGNLDISWFIYVFIHFNNFKYHVGESSYLTNIVTRRAYIFMFSLMQ